MSKPVILCVDDERIMLDCLRTQLFSSLGNNYSYEVAEDAEEALELIEELTQENLSIVVVISDWLMPGMKGDELLIRIHEQFPEIVKIMLTGQADEVAVNRAEKFANLHCCLSKPWSEAELLETIESGLCKL